MEGRTVGNGEEEGRKEWGQAWQVWGMDQRRGWRHGAESGWEGNVAGSGVRQGILFKIQTTDKNLAATRSSAVETLVLGQILRFV